MYYPRAGTQHYFVPLLPPQGLEFMQIVNRQAAETGDAGRSVLACEARGFGLFSWAVVVNDLEAVSHRLGIPIDDYTISHGDGTLRGWRTVSGPDHLPFFIDYPNNGDRKGRLRAMYERVGHAREVHHFSMLTIEGDEREMQDWLGPNDLPLRFHGGTTGLIEAQISTTTGPVLIPQKRA